jgi:hypothetical protein
LIGPLSSARGIRVTARPSGGTPCGGVCRRVPIGPPSAGVVVREAGRTFVLGTVTARGRPVTVSARVDGPVCGGAPAARSLTDTGRLLLASPPSS